MKAVYINLAGGLGNQLFQVAAAYAYARENGKHLFLDGGKWSASQGRQPYEYKNSVFQNFKYASPTREVFPYSEEQFNYSKIPFQKGDVSLSGYFQSLKYFESCKDDFINELVLPEVRTDWINDKNVAVHIRRGDYLAHHHVHLICKKEYFEKAFEEFDGYQINVFTDSPEFVQQEFGEWDFNIIQTGDELKDLTLMSHHDNMVCSNSSFSWWASLLSKKKDKILVPDIWFKNFEAHDDIFREEFTRIEVGG